MPRPSITAPTPGSTPSSPAMSSKTFTSPRPPAWSTESAAAKVKLLLKLPEPPPGLDHWEFHRRMAALAESVRQTDPAAARADLIGFLREAQEEELVRVRRLSAREAQDRAEAAQRAGCDVSREGQARLRYEAAPRRAL